jgi:hypothetical protein
MNPKQSKWDLAITIGGVTATVREPTHDELIELIGLSEFSDHDICAKIRGVFSDLTGFPADSIAIDQAFKFLDVLGDYIAARHHASNQIARRVMGVDRQWLLN